MTTCTQADHDAMKNVVVWPSLPHPRAQHWPWGEVHEMRDCPHCGSTLAIVLELGDPEDPAGEEARLAQGAS